MTKPLARFGASEIPDRWLESLHGVDDLRSLGRDPNGSSFDVRVDDT